MFVIYQQQFRFYLNFDTGNQEGQERKRGKGRGGYHISHSVETVDIIQMKCRILRMC